MFAIIKRRAAAFRERRRVSSALQYWISRDLDSEAVEIGAFRRTITLKSPEEAERFIADLRRHSQSMNIL
ncbi:MAG: hypothetical protein LBS90_00115 [Oscillospiraceae bacterium]|jgi:hypothetical protein|nr:hypothetical protein [Oscillospiraceae bacterium]